MGVGLEVIIAPATVEVFVAVEHLDLLLSESGDGGLLGVVAFVKVMKLSENAEAVCVTPVVVDGQLLGAAEAGEFVEEPGFSFGNGGEGFGSAVSGGEQAFESEGAGAGAKGVVSARNGGVDVEAFGLGGTSPRTGGILLGDEEIDATSDGALQLC